MKKAIFTIVRDQTQADQIIHHLKQIGFVDENISLLMRNGANQSETNPSSNVGLEQGTKAAEGAVAGVTLGGVIGGAVGLLAGIGTLSVPGLGALIAAGPIMAALSGSAVGGSVGLFTGSLVGLGVPEVEAKLYEERLQEGGVFIAVHCKTDGELARVEEIYKKHGAEKVGTATEKSNDE